MRFARVLLGTALVAAACSKSEEPSGGATTTTSSSTGGAGQGGHAHSTASSTGGGGAGGGCQNTLPAAMKTPDKLSATGLYSDITKKTLAPYAKEFEPTFELWSDGAEKRRYVYLPECGQIDTSNMDDWQLPVGTRIWKEFSIGGKRLETRLIHRWGPQTKDYAYVAYQWNDAQTEATAAPSGLINALGTDHDIPDEDTCKRCHGPYPTGGGMPSRYLGFSAVQLSHAGPGVTLASLIADAKLSQPPKGNFVVPGNAVEQAALGYLHANCGNCHNGTPDGIALPAFDARLSFADADVANTGTYTTMVNQKTQLFVGLGCNYRIAGGSPADSCVHFRMNERGDDATKNTKQMPPVASEVVDKDGLATIDAWIATLPAPM
jgi:hypothetical protein